MCVLRAGDLLWKQISLVKNPPPRRGRKSLDSAGPGTGTHDPSRKHPIPRRMLGVRWDRTVALHRGGSSNGPSMSGSPSMILSIRKYPSIIGSAGFDHLVLTHDQLTTLDAVYHHGWNGSVAADLSVVAVGAQYVDAGLEDVPFDQVVKILFAAIHPGIFAFEVAVLGRVPVCRASQEVISSGGCVKLGDLAVDDDPPVRIGIGILTILALFARRDGSRFRFRLRLRLAWWAQGLSASRSHARWPSGWR